MLSSGRMRGQLKRPRGPHAGSCGARPRPGACGCPLLPGSCGRLCTAFLSGTAVAPNSTASPLLRSYSGPAGWWREREGASTCAPPRGTLTRVLGSFAARPVIGSANPPPSCFTAYAAAPAPDRKESRHLLVRGPGLSGREAAAAPTSRRLSAAPPKPTPTCWGRVPGLRAQEGEALTPLPHMGVSTLSFWGETWPRSACPSPPQVTLGLWGSR